MKLAGSFESPSGFTYEPHPWTREKGLELKMRRSDEKLKDDEKLKEAVIKWLNEDYRVNGGTPLKGQTLSALTRLLRDDGFKGTERLLEERLSQIGFKVSAGKNKRGGHARVVHQ